MWQRAERHPVRAWLLFAVLALVVVDGSRHTLEAAPPEGRPLVSVIFAALAAATCGSFAVASRTDPERLGVSRTPLLLALAFAPVTLALGTAFAGATALVLWVALALALSLAGCWAVQVSAAGRSRR